ncbi:SusC/RagA family TonB-linked outer membrane protein [Bacteroides caecigallinarum]|uniref:SusC/RagA family TonB-linked outer membrane protein n=1 Tax=Bacteroides caecigallinarum TaxID=1411144 RepID=UPI001958BDEC|nr:TonB-dependent receptor [Bacteroides caecigallinarum]MBM6883262.1 TonB-dependent receptor [Bacteroides caecigallinarum]
MKKQFIFSAMLGLCAFGGTAMYPGSAIAAVAQSPTIKVRGQVIDDQGEPLLGATIRIKDGQGGTTTDLDGNFELEVPGNAVLVISYVGYNEREVAVRNRAVIEPIQLQMSDLVLEQVVVVGYGTQKKSDLTGSVAVVDAEALKQVSHSNISSMLEGKVPGVQITSDGQPGADPTVRIRGIGSFGSTAPLYVIDGVPMGTSIRDFSSNDIETIQVLKDASAAAIYGSRAANGVVIITTKRGQKDQPLKVDYNGYFGVDNISKGVYDVMDADQYSQYLGQACLNSNTPLPGGYHLDSTTGKYRFQDDTNTDWFDEVFKTGIRQNHNVNLSGGSSRSTYNVSLDYFSQKGTLEGAGPNYERFTARVNNSMDTKFVKFHTSFVYSHSDQDNMGMSNASEYVQGLYGDVTNVLRGTLLMQPTIKAYDESTWVLDDVVGIANGFNYDAYGYGVYYDTVHGDISASNPLLINTLLKRNTRVDRFVGTGSADVDLLKMIGVESKNHKLNYKINLSYSKTHCKDFTWIPAWVQSNRVYLAKSNERLTKGSRDYSDALIENILTYDGTIGKHHINIVAGQTYQEENTDLLTGWGINFTEPYFLQLQNAADTYSESFEYKHAILSYIGRVNYNYDDRYLFSATVRRDASSRLSKNIRWGTFPSVSLGWRFDKENFFPFSEDVVNMFKVRGSYGELGNENIGEYMYQAVMARNNMTYNFNNSPITGSAISTFVDNNLAWEKKKTYNVGIDLAFFRNRLEFTAEWYKNTSEDLLYAVPVPEQAGVSNTTVTMNAASMENSGFEFSATYRNRDNAFKYEVSANLSTLKNRVTSLGFGTDSYITGSYITNVGEEIGQFYGWVYEGIARTQEDLDNHAVQEGAQIGDCLYKDISGPDGTPDGKVDSYDQTVLGSGLPKVNFGLSARFEYKGFDLSIATFGALNYHVSDDIYNSLNSCYGWSNKDVAMLDANRFSEDGLTYLSDVPRTYVNNSASLAWNDLFSSRKIQNAAYWKIANVELGYNFPDKWFGKYISDVRLYVSGQNLYTFTGYKGYNVDYAGGTFTPGYNFCSFPTARTFMCGVHFTF